MNQWHRIGYRTRIVAIDSGAASELDYYTDPNYLRPPADWGSIHTDERPVTSVASLNVVRIPFLATKVYAIHAGKQVYPFVPHLQAASGDSAFYVIDPLTLAIVEVYVDDREGRRKLTYRTKGGKLVLATRTELFILKTFEKVYDSFDSDMHPDDFLRTSEYDALIARVGGRAELWYRISRRGIVRVDIAEEQRRLDDLVSWPEPMASA